MLVRAGGLTTDCLLAGPRHLDDEKRDEFGFVDDGALFEGIQEYVAKATGATLYCVQRLLDRDCLYAMHWEGGRCVIVIIDHRHHAKRDVASGFCYINDIVLAIYELSAAFDPILYIDIDIHHGDGWHKRLTVGVEEAFYHTASVTTLSFHLFEPGFFPGTGAAADRGQGWAAVAN